MSRSKFLASIFTSAAMLTNAGAVNINNITSNLSSLLGNALPDLSFSVFGVLNVQCNFSNFSKNAIAARISVNNICDYAKAKVYSSDLFSGSFALNETGCLFQYNAHSNCIDNALENSLCGGGGTQRNGNPVTAVAYSLTGTAPSSIGAGSKQSTAFPLNDKSRYVNLIQPYVHIYDDAMNKTFSEDNSTSVRTYDGDYVFGDSYKEVEIECKIAGKECDEPKKVALPNSKKERDRLVHTVVKNVMNNPYYGMISDSSAKRDLYEKYLRDNCFDAQSETTCMKNLLENNTTAPFEKELAETDRRANIFYAAKNYFIEKAYSAFHKPLYYGNEYQKTLPAKLRIEYSKAVVKQEAFEEYLRAMLKRSKSTMNNAQKVIYSKNKNVSIFYAVKDSAKSYKELLDESVTQ